MAVTPELQHLHVLIADPALAGGWIGKLFGGDRRHRGITERPERSKGPPDVIRDQLDDNVGIVRKTQLSMSIHRESAGDEIPDTGIVEGADNRLKTRQFHNGAIVANVWIAS
jgi:hypothetical protein